MRTILGYSELPLHEAKLLMFINIAWSRSEIMLLLYGMNTRFYIEKRKDESGRHLTKERPVLMSVTFSGNRVILGTGIKVDFHGWDPEIQRIKATYPGAIITNSWLDSLSDTASIALNALQDTPEASDPEHFRLKFRELKPKFSAGFFEVYYLFMETNSSHWNTSTYRKVRTIYNHLREFEDQTGYRISFNNLDASFLDKFVAFYAEKGNSQSTTHKAVNFIVWFLNWATDQGYNTYREYRSFYKLLAPVSRSARSHVFLQWEELMKIRNWNPDSRKKERIRDMFCFMCFSGVRFAELQTLKKEDVNDEEIIIRKQGKDPRRLPMNTYTRAVYKTYENKYYMNNTAFPSMSVMTLNKYLKMMGQELGLNRSVTSATDEAVKTPLYERMTAGIAVNTFVSNALELEVPVEIIAGFTGIQNDSRLRRIKMDLARQEMQKFDKR